MKRIKILFSCLLILGFTVPAFADKLSDMERQIENITDELAELKMEQPTEEYSKTHSDKF